MARLTRGEERFLKHFLKHGTRELHGPFEPLTQGTAHQLAPTVIPAPAPPPVPAGVRVDRYGGVTGGALGLSRPQQFDLNPNAAFLGAATNPEDRAPSYLHKALVDTGLLDAFEKERTTHLDENLKEPADLTNAIVLAATAGLGAPALSAGRAAEVGATALADGAAVPEVTTASKLVQGAAQAVTAPLRHPVITASSPVIAQVPSAAESGNPSKLLYGLEGTGVLASTLGGAGAKIEGAVPGILGHAASDLINLPAQALPSLYLSGRAGLAALGGDNEELNSQVNDFTKQSAIAALVQGHLGEAAERFYQHPVYSYLEGEGVKSAIGHLGGRAGSAAGAFQRNEPRPGLSIYGDRVQQRAPYSNDFLRKAGEKRRDRARGPATDLNVIDWVAKQPDTAPVKIPLQATQQEITNYLNDFADRRAYGNENHRKGLRDRRRKEIEDAKPAGKADREIVGLQAQGIISHDPVRARLDLAAYREKLVKAQNEGVTNRDGETVRLTKSQVRQNQDLVKKIDNAIADATLDNRPALEAMAKLDRELSGQIIEKGVGLEGGPQQARIARAIPHAAHFLESKYGLTNATALELAQEIAGDNRLGPKARLRGRRQVLDKNGDALSVDAIEKSMRDNGIDPELVSYVDNRQPAEPDAEPGGGIHYQVPDERGSLRNRARTGSAVSKGLVDPRWEAMVNQVTHGGTIVDRAVNHDYNIDQVGIRKPDGKAWASGDEAADAIAHPEDYGMKALPEIPGGYVAYRVTGFPPTKGALDATKDVGQHRMETEGEIGQTTGDGEQIPELNYSPVDGAEFTENSHRDSVVEFGTKDASKDGPVVIVPRTVVNRLGEHYAKTTTFEKGLQKLTGTFKGAVLPTSVKWLAGNAIDNWLVRSLLTGTITDIPSGIRFARYIKLVLDEQGPEAAQRAMESILPGTVFSSVKLTQPNRGADQFIGTKVAPLASAIHKFFETPGPKQVANIWRHYRDTVFALDSKYVEQLPQYGALGKVARREVNMTRRAFKKAIADQEPALRDLAEGLRNPDNIDRAAKGVERVFGNWGKNSPTARRFFTTYAPFWQWARAATKFVYVTLPRDHPVLTGLLAASQTMTREERLMLGFDFDAEHPLPDWMQGSIPDPGNPGGVLAVGGLTSFGSFANPVNFLTSNALPPLFAPIALAGLGVDWKGDKLVKANGEPMNDIEKAKVAVTSSAEAYIPFMSAIKSITGGKSEHAYNPIRSYPKSTVDLSRQPRQEISVPVSPESSSSEADPSSAVLEYVEGLETEKSPVEEYVEGLE
jgi:hypothetical protein